jgi:hypothetical protein
MLSLEQVGPVITINGFLHGFIQAHRMGSLHTLRQYTPLRNYLQAWLVLPQAKSVARDRRSYSIAGEAQYVL